MPSKNISFSVKLQGWKQLQQHAEQDAKSLDKLGDAAERSGRDAQSAQRGWGIFERQQKKTRHELAATNRESQKTSRGFAGMRASTKGGIGAFAVVGGGAAAAAAAVGAIGFAVGKTGIAFDAFAETQETAFETLLGSKSKASSFMEDLKKASAATPFELADLTQSSQKLLAFGFNVKQTKGLLTDLGNASSSLGSGAEGFAQLSTIFGQIKAKGKLQGDEVLQLAEGGIPALQILQKELGLTGDEFDKKLSSGAIKSDQAIRALQRGMQRLYGGGMQRQSKTFSGQWSTLKDNFQQLAGRAAKPLFDYLRDKGIPAMNGLIEGFSKGTGAGGKISRAMQAVGRVLSGTVWPAIQRGSAAIRAFAVQHGPKLIKFGRELWGTFRRAVGPIRPIGTALALVGRRVMQFARFVAQAAWPMIRRALPGISQSFRGVAQVVGGVVRTITALIHGDWRGAWRGLKTIVRGALNAVLGSLRTFTAPIREVGARMWGGLKAGFKGAVNWIIGAWNGLSFTIGGTDLGPFGHLPKTTLNTPDIPKLALGGIARMPGTAIVGDKGPELLSIPRGARVDPLPRDGGGARELVAHITNRIVLPNGAVLAEESAKHTLRATRRQPRVA